MTGKIPRFGAELFGGHVGTGTAVQTGCVYCLHAGLKAPALDHVSYMWAGTSYCSEHLQEHIFKTAGAANGA